MIARILEWSLQNRLIVALMAVLLAVAGVWAVRTTPVDALPDLSDVQVIVYTEYPGQAPEVVEDQVTYPLSTALLAVPRARDVRATSFFGFSLAYVLFEDGTDLYEARSRVLEALDAASDRLPPEARTRLGPDATGVGWVYIYTLSDATPRAEVLRRALDLDESGVVEARELPTPDRPSPVHGARVRVYDQATLAAYLDTADPPGFQEPDGWVAESLEHLVPAFDRDGDGALSRAELERAANFRGVDLEELRSLQDWQLRYELTGLPGVAEVASVGGFVREVQVEVDPERLRAFGVGLEQVRTALRRANQDLGGRILEMAETEFMVRGRGYLADLDDLRDIPIAVDAESHVPVLLRQVGRVQEVPAQRRGLVDRNGQGEVVSGIVVMRHQGDALAVIDAVESKLDELRGRLPEGVEIHVSYDRSALIERSIESLAWKLGEELLVVAVVTMLLLLHLRSAAVALVVLPLGVLGSFVGMRLLGVGADVMSLAGIAIALGVMVDAAVVMVENVHKHRERDPDAPQLEVVRAATREVGPALFWSLLVVTVSFLPVFALTGQEGRLFRPLAWTKTLALASATLLSITLLPVLCLWFVRGHLIPEHRHPVSRLLMAVYRPLVRASLRRWPLTLGLGLLLTVAALLPLSRLGTSFLPPLDEGDLLYMPTTSPGLSVTKARELLQQTDRLIASHPQVDEVLGKIGRAGTATDPAPLTMIETHIQLTPRDTWPAGKTREDVIRELDERVRIPGLTNAWTQPIRTRIDMLATGIKTPVGVKLLGDDLEVLDRVGREIEAVIEGMPGTRSVYSERVTGGRYVDIDIRRRDAARYGVNVDDLQAVVGSAIGGLRVTTLVDGLERVPVTIRYPRELRDDVDDLGRIAVPTPMGHTVPLSQVADVRIRSGPPAIKSEDARRTAWIYVDTDVSDLGGYVARAKEAVERQVQLPPGVGVDWSGQYAAMQRAWARLAVVIPLTLGLIVLLLALHFRRLGETVLVLLTLPFAAVGGLFAVQAAGYPVSVAVVVGFIALAGLAAETGVVMLVYLREAVDRARREGRLTGPAALADAVVEGAAERLRPKVMTVATTLLGLAPVLLGEGPAVEILRRIALPMVGGLLSSALLTLVLLPVAWWGWQRVRVAVGLDAWSPETPEAEPGTC